MRSQPPKLHFNHCHRFLSLWLHPLPATTIASKSLSTHVFLYSCLRVQPLRLHCNDSLHPRSYWIARAANHHDRTAINIFIGLLVWLLTRPATTIASEYRYYCAPGLQAPRLRRNRSHLTSCMVVCALNHHDHIAIAAFIFRLAWSLALSSTTTASQSLLSSSFLCGCLRFQSARLRRNHSRHLPSCMVTCAFTHRDRIGAIHGNWYSYVVACTFSHHVFIAIAFFILRLARRDTIAIAAGIIRMWHMASRLSYVRLAQKIGRRWLQKSSLKKCKGSVDNDGISTAQRNCGANEPPENDGFATALRY